MARAAPIPPVPLSGDAAADAFVAREPLALLIGLVLDQQQPIERAFLAPLELSARLGHAGTLDATALSVLPLDELVAAFSIIPALHRFPRSMAERTQQLCAHLATTYGGRAADVWATAADGPTLLCRARALPGFGEHKAKVLVALLGKRLGVTPPGWREASHPYGEPGTLASIADITSFGELPAYRELKKARKSASARPAGASAPGAAS